MKRHRHLRGPINPSVRRDAVQTLDRPAPLSVESVAKERHGVGGEE